MSPARVTVTRLAESKPVAAPPQPAPPDTTPRTIAFVGTGVLALVAAVTAAVAAHRRKEKTHDHPNRAWRCCSSSPRRWPIRGDSDIDRWILGIAIAVVLVAVRVVAWAVRHDHDRSPARGLARATTPTPKPSASNDATVLLRVDDPAGVGLSLPLIAGYVDRFGVRCEKVRVTSRDAAAVPARHGSA